jgi:glucose/arabinose dehydrogenase/PKD repeat protein
VLVRSRPRHVRRGRPRRHRLTRFAAGLAITSLLAATGCVVTPLPQGFLLQSIPTGLAHFDLTNFAFLPGGNMLVTGKSGTLRLVSPNTGASQIVTTNPPISVNSCGDRGLVGIALANDYATSGRLYLLYNTPAMSSCPSTYPLDQTDMIWGRLSQWTVDNPSSPAVLTGETVLADNILSDGGPSHTIGTVQVAPDNTIYLGAGDSSSFLGPDPDHALRAQMTDSPNGKILHVNPDGSGVATNPFYDASAPNSWHSKVYAMGFRNPFRFDLRPGTSTLYIGDVGWNNAEEVDVGRPGGNYGWPCYEGPDQTEGYKDLAFCQSFYANPPPNLMAPLWSYPHIWAAGAAVIGGTFYTATIYPPAYQGAYIFGDYVTGTIWTLTTDSQDNLTRIPELWNTPRDAFGVAIGSPVAFHTGPGGDIYFADIASSTVQRLRYFPGNSPPVALVSSDATNGSSSLVVHLVGSGSYDSDGDLTTYSWDFGDGSPQALVSDTAHTYPGPGVYTATLTVTDSLGAASSASLTVKPGDSPPTLTFTTPPAEKLFSVGDPLSLTATATDSFGRAIPPSSIDWRADIHHCPITTSSCHIHPGSDVTGTVFSMGFPDHGDTSYLEITATATDASGVFTSATYIAPPELHTLSISSAPSGVPLDINATTSLAHPEVSLIAGSTNFVVAPATSGALQFQSWSDGGATSHSFTMPHQDLTMTAFYQPLPQSLAIDSELSGEIPGNASGAASLTGVSTSAPGDLLLALVGADSPAGNQSVTVSGAGLTWTLVRRSNTQNGDAEIWQARAVGALNGAMVTSTVASTGCDGPGCNQSITVIAFKDASGVGASVNASGPSGAPTASVTTTKSGGWVFGVGYDWDNAIARTLGPGQTMISQFQDSLAGTFWAQSMSAPADITGTSVTINDTAPTTDRWDLSAVEVIP